MKILFTLLLIGLAIAAVVYFTVEVSLAQATSAFLSHISNDYSAGRYRAVILVVSGLVEVQPYTKDPMKIAMGMRMAEPFLLHAGQVEMVEGTVKSVFPGVEVMNASFKNVEYHLPADVIWKDIAFDLKITDRRAAKYAESLSVRIDQVSIAPEDIKERIVRITLKGINANLQGFDARVPAKLQSVQVPGFSVRFQVRSLNPRDILEEVRDLLHKIAAKVENAQGLQGLKDLQNMKELKELQELQGVEGMQTLQKLRNLKR